jgi:hypothetical protein
VSSEVVVVIAAADVLKCPVSIIVGVVTVVVVLVGVGRVLTE